MSRIELFVIDGQNDFCASGNMPDIDGGRRGTLCVDQADREALLVAELINRLGKKLHKIHVTLDTHHFLDASHNVAWCDRSGCVAPAFTLVSSADVSDGKWAPRFRYGVWEGKQLAAREWALLYTAALERSERGPLCLWPVHCQIGTWGNNLFLPLRNAFDQWCETTGDWINFIQKGQWVWTEHYSGLQADVPDPTREETQMNVAIVEEAMRADRVLWCGWAGSHCLRYTVLDAVNYFGAGSNEFVSKCVIFEDACAPVPDIPGAAIKFSQWRKSFLEELKERGALVTTTAKFIEQELLG